MENFRDLLVMEEGRSLWLARATPRAWLEQGKRIAVEERPDLLRPAGLRDRLGRGPRPDHRHRRDALAAIRRKRVLVRFRHPKAVPIKSVTVNGKAWSDFDPAKEVVRLHDVQGSVKVEAAY